MDEDLYPPGMAPSQPRRAKQLPAPTAQPAQAVRVRTPVLPPGSDDGTDDASIYDAARLEGELPPDPALPPMAESSPGPTLAHHLPLETPAAPISAPIALSTAPIRFSTAPKAAYLAQRRDKTSATFLFLTIATSVALLVLVGAAYLKLADRATKAPEVVEEPPLPPRLTRRPRPRSSRSVAAAPRERPEAELLPMTQPLDAIPAEAPAPATTDDPPNSPMVPLSPPPQPPPPQVTRAEVQQLIKALEAAKTALGEQNFELADTEFAKAESLAKLPAHQSAVARLKEAGNYVKQFHDAVASAAAGMKAGESFKVGTSTQVSFVEADSDRIILRIAGMNKTYKLNDLPPGLALALVDFKLPPSDPQSKVLKGAYLLVHKRSDSETQAKARELWEEAAATGRDTSHLMPLLSEKYADLVKDATH